MSAVPAVLARPGVVVQLANAFDPSRHRIIEPVPVPVSVRGWLDARGIAEFPQPTICLFNGAALLRAQWTETVIGPGDVCAFVALPQGGGGGGGKNPLKTVLAIAVMIAAPEIAAWMAPELAAAAAASTSAFSGASLAFGALKAGIAIAGTALINAVIPSPRPATPQLSFGGAGSTPAPSPTYTLTAQGNQARLGQPIPVIYGRHLVYPDLATDPWQEYVENQQFLHQLHVIGQGEYEIEAIRIEDTPIASFAEVQTEIVPPGGAVTLFEVNVVTAPEVAGQELLKDAPVGPFAANPVDTAADSLGIDMVFPRGLYFTNATGGLDPRTVSWTVEAREIDADGVPPGAGSWAVLGAESHTASTSTAIRLSFRYPVTPGRYEVRLTRTDVKDTDARAGHEARWGQMRAYLAEVPAFEGLTLLAVRMRATDNLSQRSSRLINAIVTRKLPAWDPVTQSWGAPTATRSIIRAIADVCKAAYGAERPDAQLPLDDWAALDAVLDARGDRFDAVFDTSITVWEALNRIARCGRAVPILQGGRIRIIRDAPQSLPVALFGPRNIIRGSFEIEYIMPGEETADAVTVEFFSSRTWKPDEVTQKLADSAGDRPARVQLFGCTDTAHASREGLYVAANNRYRRRFVRFRTELEGMIPLYGDLIAVAHDMPRWGQGGEITAWTADGVEDPGAQPPWANAVLTLSEPPVWTAGAAHYIALRRRDGSVAGPYQVEAVPGSKTRVRLVDDLEISPSVGTAEERTHYSFGPGVEWARLCRLIGTRPRSGGEQVEIVAVTEDERVHAN
jgi:hypothetical protein